MSKYLTIATVSFHSQAVVIQSKLESEGVFVNLKDEFTVATDPFASNALGGVKIQVFKEDVLKATGIIEQFAPEALSKKQVVSCPNCLKRNVRQLQDIYTAITFAQKLKAIGLSLFPFPNNDRKHECLNCQNNFTINE